MRMPQQATPSRQKHTFVLVQRDSRKFFKHPQPPHTGGKKHPHSNGNHLLAVKLLTENTSHNLSWRKLMGRCQAPKWTGHLCSPYEGANHTVRRCTATPQANGKTRFRRFWGARRCCHFWEISQGEEQQVAFEEHFRQPSAQVWSCTRSHSSHEECVNTANANCTCNVTRQHSRFLWPTCWHCLESNYPASCVPATEPQRCHDTPHPHPTANPTWNVASTMRATSQMSLHPTPTQHPTPRVT